MDNTKCAITCDFNEEGYCTVGMWQKLEQYKKEGKLPSDCEWWLEYRGSKPNE